MNNHELKTRREFIRTGLLGGSLSWTLPAFLSRTMQTLHAQADGALIQGATGRDGNILVVLQLAGEMMASIPSSRWGMTNTEKLAQPSG